MVFGAGWTAALLGECASIRGPGGGAIPHKWPLTVFGLETGGLFSTTLLQANAKIVPAYPADADGFPDQRSEVAGTGGMRLTHGTGARGLWQKMPRRLKRSDPAPDDAQRRKPIPDLLYLYEVTDPVKQMREGFAFWRAMMKTFSVPSITSVEAFYCLNFAPARLKGGAYHDETIIYAKDASYRANRWLDLRKDDRKPELVANGKIELVELRGALVDSERGARFREELAMADEMKRDVPTEPELDAVVPLATWNDVQRELERRGLYSGRIDGAPGPKTLAAVCRALEQARAEENHA